MATVTPMNSAMLNLGASGIGQSPTMHVRASYGARSADTGPFQRINWSAVGLTLGLEAVLLATFLHLGIVPMGKQDARQPTVVELLPATQASAPAQQSAPPQAPEKPVAQPQAPTAIIAPVPEVVLPMAAPVQAAAQPLPVSPAPVVSAEPAPVSAPSVAGPVNVPNLGASLLSGTPPRYPVESRRKREQGTVVLRLVISEQGRVTDIAIHKSSGFALLDNAATEAVRRWRWSPTHRDGRPVPVTGLVQIPFILKES